MADKMHCILATAPNIHDMTIPLHFWLYAGNQQLRQLVTWNEHSGPYLGYSILKQRTSIYMSITEAKVLFCQTEFGCSIWYNTNRHIELNNHFYKNAVHEINRNSYVFLKINKKIFSAVKENVFKQPLNIFFLVLLNIVITQLFYDSWQYNKSKLM
jgi:hypothetical protein